MKKLFIFSVLALFLFSCTGLQLKSELNIKGLIEIEDQELMSWEEMTTFTQKELESWEILQDRYSPPDEFYGKALGYKYSVTVYQDPDEILVSYGVL